MRAVANKQTKEQTVKRRILHNFLDDVIKVDIFDLDLWPRDLKRTQSLCSCGLSLYRLLFTLLYLALTKCIKWHEDSIVDIRIWCRSMLCSVVMKRKASLIFPNSLLLHIPFLVLFPIFPVLHFQSSIRDTASETVSVLLHNVVLPEVYRIVN